MLFNLYVERAVVKVVSESDLGIKVNGVLIKNTRYADDTATLADSADALQALLRAIDKAGEKIGLNINIEKRKFMIISRNPIQGVRIRINGKNTEQARNFRYLTCLINDK